MKKLSIDLLVKNHNNIIDRNSMAEIEFEAECEDMQPDMDEPYLTKFLRKLEKDRYYQYCGVSANWFRAKVMVRYRGFEETDYLGGCSYKSYDQFVKLKGDYFTDMVQTCVDRINEQVVAHNDAIKSSYNLRKDMIRNGHYKFYIDNMQALKSF